MRYAICDMRIIVGLGNPGSKYQYTRHNVGFMVLDALVETKDLSWQTNKKFSAQFIKDGETIYLKPLTMMNNSGVAVAAVMNFYQFLPKTLLFLTAKDTDLSETLSVVHDDMDIELNKFKVSIGSRSAGHQGVESIIATLKTKNFRRVRIGIKYDKPEAMPTTAYVLREFPTHELLIIKELIPEILSEL